MKYDIKNLTLDEKIELLCGRNGWQLANANGKLPDVFLSDGPHGLRMHDINEKDLPTKKATAMPNLHMVANTWDVELAYLDGQTIADDCIENGADVLLAPGVNIKRTPLCGRNFEYFSEDPILAGTLAKAYIEGVQSKGIGTSLKHYCCNNREYDRFFQTSEVDERTLREIYLPAFEIALQAKPWTVMSAYNPVNGVYASENSYTVKEILREEFGFDGLVMSDWCAVYNSARMAKATVDLRMPHHADSAKQLKDGLACGYITEAEIDARVEKVLALMEKTQNGNKKVTTTKAQRHENAVKIAREGIVLLKNENNILPLKKGSFLVAGQFAGVPCYGGAGSACVVSEYKCPDLAEALNARFGADAKAERAHGHVGESLYQHGAKRGYYEAYGKDAVVLCLGTGWQNEGEAWDKVSIKLSPIQESYIQYMAKYNENVIVVLNAGSAVDMSAWIDKVKAVVLLGFGGEGAQEALADVLTGKACPCGKLSETFPLCLEDTPTGVPTDNAMVDRYKEGVLVGYRWYDTMEKEVLFPFGHGLSYAQFAYSDLTVEKNGETDYVLSFNVKNVSNVDGKEIAQVYVRDVFAMVERPYKELKGFAKVALKAGESKRVQIALDSRAFAYYNTIKKQWYVEDGDFEILIGASSRDIRLKESIRIQLPFDTQSSQGTEA